MGGYIGIGILCGIIIVGLAAIKAGENVIARKKEKE